LIHFYKRLQMVTETIVITKVFEINRDQMFDKNKLSKKSKFNAF